jgi:hypothetical protein
MIPWADDLFATFCAAVPAAAVQEAAACRSQKLETGHVDPTSMKGIQQTSMIGR